MMIVSLSNQYVYIYIYTDTYELLGAPIPLQLDTSMLWSQMCFPMHYFLIFLLFSSKIHTFKSFKSASSLETIEM